VTPLSLGIETSGGVHNVLIPRNTTVPVRKTSVFTTTRDNQPTVDVLVFEGERSRTSKNHLLGSFALEGVAPAPRGVPQIEVTFDIDADGIIHVSAEDRNSGVEGRIRISNDRNRLSPEDIERMVAEAERFAAADRQVREGSVARNDLESYAFALRHAVESGALPVPDDRRPDALAAIDAETAWAQAHPDAPADESRARLAALQGAWEPLVEAAKASRAEEAARAEAEEAARAEAKEAARAEAEEAARAEAEEAARAGSGAQEPAPAPGEPEDGGDGMPDTDSDDGMPDMDSDYGSPDDASGGPEADVVVPKRG